MGKDRFIFRYTGDSENAEQEFSMLKSKKEVKVIDESPRMILGEAEPSFINKVKDLLNSWKIIPYNTYSIPDHQIKLGKK